MSAYSYDENPFGDSYGYEATRQSGGNGRANSQAPSASDDKIRRNKEQIRDLTDIMQQNINKAMDRDVKLNDLERNAEDLEFRATDFQRTSTKAKRHFLIKNAKWTIILIIVVLLIILIVALIIGLTVSNNTKKNGN